ncbi:hypothetical protein VW23_024845 [Devosia insulae DS-56]|uniref:Imelysin-like domain-containing protein n=1 Tax=Devosia insulae DS-56 TaxID=1116389 RepID=A0A1E5XLZ4_9HYPH|nr:hypothetical protein [Devosia insulae]OEO29602.1 hypothetical protein VW23_024845 [Devosia insulae DS-56]
MRKFLLPLAAFALAVATLTGGPAAAQDEADLGRIGQMNLKELAALVGAVTQSVGRDTIKLQPAAQRNDCAELSRASNAFGLGYRLLAEARGALEGKPARDIAALQNHIVQARVITFAARVRAEEWLSRQCASFAMPADKAAEPRYAKPIKLQTAEYTQAMIEARQAAETNLALAVAAGIGKKCPEVISAIQSIQLFVPYLDKLSKDVAKRPEALGPRASRRGLEVARIQLINAGNKLYRELRIGCRAKPPADAEAPADGAPPPAQ